MVEMMAQSFGFAMAHYHYHLKGKYTGFKKTFVAGHENIIFSKIEIKSDETLYVKVKKIKEISTIAFVEGQVTSFDNKELYCKGILKLFSEY